MKLTREQKRLRRRRGEEGRIKSKIRSLMLELGWEVVDFWEQHGDYRIRKYQWDLACWGCTAFITSVDCRCDGHKQQLACWATMTECVRFGLTVDYSDRDGWEINPKTEDIAYDNMLAATEVN